MAHQEPVKEGASQVPTLVLDVRDPNGVETEFRFFEEVLESPDRAVATACRNNRLWETEPCIETMLPIVKFHLVKFHLVRKTNEAAAKNQAEVAPINESHTGAVQHVPPIV